MVVATYNVHTLAAKERNGYGRDKYVLVKVQELGCVLVVLWFTTKIFHTGRILGVPCLMKGYCGEDEAFCWRAICLRMILRHVILTCLTRWGVIYMNLA